MRLLFLLLPLAALAADEVPRAAISNGVLDARIDLPDAAKGYYRGTRFDWSGQISSLRFRGHDFFGQWNAKVDPNLHDSIMGPVEEFRSADGGLGYADAKPGGLFVRIGVGVVRRGDEPEFQPFKTYEIVDSGTWKVSPAKDRIEFTHQLESPIGYSYVYTKTLRLEPGKPVLTIHHRLRNTGKKTIDTLQYNHNFFVMDARPTGPDARVRFAFPAQATMDLKGLAEVRGSELNYLKELAAGESVFTHLSGFGNSARDYDLRLEHKAAGIGVRITGDRPIERFVYWSIRSTFCPEPYIRLTAAPGAETSWTYTYEFYELK